jgi:dTDP-4-amino-4,6-dideoxy-D-galactose acyltransferase
MTAKADAGAPCRFLDFDSRLFQRRIATMTARTIDRPGLERALAWCAERRIDCLYFLAAGDDAATLRLARDRGFEFVDVRMTLERSLSGAQAEAAGANRLRLAREADVPALREIAAASHVQSRFWVDERFDRRACAELYATWIERSCQGYADAVWVAEDERGVAGYLTCHRREGGAGEIGLVGVAGRAQGRGLGRALLARGIEWFRGAGCERARVVTQGANVPAQRLYQAAGFQTASVEIWHHLWRTADEGARA